MPKALDPSYRFAAVLESDKDQANPPTFYFRAANGREWRKILELEDGAKTSAERIDCVFAQLRLTLVDWKHLIDPATGQPIPFDAAELDCILGVYEADELLGLVLKQARLGVDDKKKSDEPPSSNLENSVSNAETANA